MNYILFLFFILHTVPVAIKAEATSIQSNNFCENPYEAICGITLTNRATREKTIKKLSGKILTSSFLQLSQKYNQVINIEDVLDASSESGLRKDYERINLEIAQEILKGQVGENHLTDIKEGVRSYFLKAIKRLTPRGKTQDRLIESINNTEIYYSHELFSNNDPINDTRAAYMFQSKCGVLPNYFSDAAYSYTDLENEIRAATLCSGRIYSHLSPKEDSRNIFHGDFFTMAHEVGHNIDARIEPLLYTSFLGCMQKNYQNQLGPYKLNIFDRKTKKFKKILRSEDVAYRQARELTSDYWAREAIAEYLYENKDRFTKQKKLEILAASYGSRCTGNNNSATHPGGIFRINSLLQSSRLQKAMNCKRDDIKICKVEERSLLESIFNKFLPW